MKLIWLALCIAAIVSTRGENKVRDYLSKPPEWFRSAEASTIAENILSFQTSDGDWPKNTNTSAARFVGNRSGIKGTFDNGATIPELRFLARIYNATKTKLYAESFNKGFDHIVAAQYPNGGWPQSFPPGKGYPRHITFNDDAMVNILKFLREVATDPAYEFAGEPRRKSAHDAFEKGIQCILKCQVRIDGKLTAWCAQHDEVTLAPRPARSYELASLSGSESAGIVHLLMSLAQPSPEVIASVDAAIAWFESVKLTGIRQVQVKDPNAPKGWDKRIVEDPTAPPLWARFYDIKTMKPMFVDRDGIPKERLSEIGYERRNGYSWLGNSPAAVVAEYPHWKTNLVAR